MFVEWPGFTRLRVHIVDGVVHRNRGLGITRGDEIEFPQIVDHVPGCVDARHIGRHELVDLGAILLHL